MQTNESIPAAAGSGHADSYYAATATFLEGLWDGQAATMHPLNYVLGLAQAARNAGVRIFENSRVTKYARDDPAMVTTAQGYSGHGISIANFAGKVIAEAIAGTAERFDVMASMPIHTFPGGTLLRYPGMVLGMLYYSLKDRL